MIKAKGKILTLKSPARVTVNPNWCNSMYAYYPSITATYYINNEVINETFDLGECEPYTIEKTLEADIDQSMLYDLELHEKRIRDGIEQKIVRKGKTVEVIGGRKVPIGTIGQVFWIGNTMYGESVGIETKQGRVFTSRSNVKVINNNINSLFER